MSAAPSIPAVSPQQEPALTSTAARGSQDADHERTLKYLADHIKSIRYGSVEVVIHDGRVVQIETREKRRLDPT